MLRLVEFEFSEARSSELSAMFGFDDDLRWSDRDESVVFLGRRMFLDRFESEWEKADRESESFLDD